MKNKKRTEEIIQLVNECLSENHVCEEISKRDFTLNSSFFSSYCTCVQIEQISLISRKKLIINFKHNMHDCSNSEIDLRAQRYIKEILRGFDFEPHKGSDCSIYSISADYDEYEKYEGEGIVF
jgi:hypothetical protein